MIDLHGDVPCYVCGNVDWTHIEDHANNIHVCQGCVSVLGRDTPPFSKEEIELMLAIEVDIH
jgi:hypothetical protein